MTFREYIKDYVDDLVKEDGLTIDEIEDYLERRAHLDKKYMDLYESYYF